MGYNDAYEDEAPSATSANVVVRSMLKSSLKWGLIGAAVGALAFIVLGGAFIASVPFGGAIAAAATALFPSTIIPAAASAIVPGIMWGAIAGAGGGAIAAFANSGEAIQAEKENAQAKLDNFRMRRESNALLSHQRDLQAVEMEHQMQMAGMAPNVDYSMGPPGMGNGGRTMS